MNRSMFQMCLSIIHGPSNTTSRSMMKHLSKLSIIHVSDRSYFVNFILGDRKINLPPHVDKKREETPSFQSFSLFESFKIRQERRSKICEVLQCSSVDASDIMQQENLQPQFDDPEMSEILFEKLKFLHEAGLDTKVITQNPWLFNFSLGDLEKKLEVLRQKNPEFFDENKICLLKLPRSDLVDLVGRLQQDEENLMETRIEFFSREFNLTVPEVCALLVQRSFLRRKNLQQIISIFHILLDAGVTPQEMKTDFWIFKHKKQTLEERINLAKLLKFKQFKCWMSRCTLRALKRSAEIFNSNRKVLDQFSSKETLLMRKLGVNEVGVKRICDTYPQLLRVREAKLLYMIDFLLSEGFSTYQIIGHPKILCHSPRTLKKRINELSKLNVNVQNLYVLCLNQRFYERFIERVLSGVDQTRSASLVSAKVNNTLESSSKFASNNI